MLVVPTAEELPAKLEPLREYNGDKLLVALDPDDPEGLALEVGYRLARARVLMARAGTRAWTAPRCTTWSSARVHAMEDVRRSRASSPGPRPNIDRAYELVEEMAARVRGHLAEVDALVLAGSADADAAPADDDQLEL